MKLWIFSDLHSYVTPALRAPEGTDVIVVAGDTVEGGPRAVDVLDSHFSGTGAHIVTVLGNHEFYRRAMDRERREARKRGDELGISVLDNSVLEIDGVRFVGCTLWTDYMLYADGSEEHQRAYMRAAALGLNDHRLIQLSETGSARFSPEHARALHLESRAFIEAELAKPFAGPTVVVSHHCPHPNSVHQAFVGDKLTPAFCSDLSDVIERYQPALWIHGHTHSSFDYMVGKTRVICNPKGYGRENRHFDPQLVVEI